MVDTLKRLSGPETIAKTAAGTTLYTCPVDTTTMVREIILTNTNPSRDAYVDLAIGALTTPGNRVATGLMIRAASTVVAPITVVLSASDTLRARSKLRRLPQLSLVNKVADADSSSATSYASLSWTTEAYTPYILTVVNTHNSAAAVPSSITDTHTGISWTQLQTVVDSNGTARITQYRAESGADVNTTTTINFTGAQTGCIFVVDEVRGGDISGSDGDACIFAQGSDEQVVASTGFTMVSDDFLTARHFAFAHLANEATTPDGRFTELADATIATPALGVTTLWSSVPGGECTPSWTTSTDNALACALEVTDSETSVVVCSMGIEVK